jgi:hypothetical protein
MEISTLKREVMTHENIWMKVSAAFDGIRPSKLPARLRMPHPKASDQAESLEDSISDQRYGLLNLSDFSGDQFLKPSKLE